MCKRLHYDAHITISFGDDWSRSPAKKKKAASLIDLPDRETAPLCKEFAFSVQASGVIWLPLTRSRVTRVGYMGGGGGAQFRRTSVKHELYDGKTGPGVSLCLLLRSASFPRTVVMQI